MIDAIIHPSFNTTQTLLIKGALNSVHKVESVTMQKEIQLSTSSGSMAYPALFVDEAIEDIRLFQKHVLHILHHIHIWLVSHMSNMNVIF